MKYLKTYKLYEGIYDRSIGELTETLMECIKNNIDRDIDDDIIFEKEFQFGKVWVDTDVNLELNKKLRLAYDIKASADRESISVEITLNPMMFPRFYIELVPEIKGTLRHELEHVSQIKSKGEAPIRKKSITIHKYFLLKREVLAFVREMHTKAKYYKRPIVEIIKEFVEGYSDALTKEEIQEIQNSWIKASKSLFRQ